MKYTVHTLELHRPITAPADGISPDGTEKLYEYLSRVTENTLEPALEDHLAEGKTASEITPGYYLFVQDRMPEDGTGEAAWMKAAEALWLESLWREIPFTSDRILVRILSEDGKRVFQLFRAIR